MLEIDFEPDLDSDPSRYVRHVLRTLGKATGANRNVLPLAVSQLRQGRPLEFVYFTAVSLSRHWKGHFRLEIDDDFRVCSRLRTGELLAVSLAELEAVTAWQDYRQLKSFLSLMKLSQSSNPSIGKLCNYTGTKEKFAENIKAVYESLNRSLHWNYHPECRREVRFKVFEQMHTATSPKELSALFSQAEINTFCGIDDQELEVPFRGELVEAAQGLEWAVLNYLPAPTILNDGPVEETSLRAFAQTRLAAAFRNVVEAVLQNEEELFSEYLLREKFFDYLKLELRYSKSLVGLVNFYCQYSDAEIDEVIRDVKLAKRMRL